MLRHTPAQFVIREPRGLQGRLRRHVAAVLSLSRVPSLEDGTTNAPSQIRKRWRRRLDTC